MVVPGAGGMDHNRAIVDAIDSIYAAAFDARSWPDALKKVSGILGTAGACVFAMDNATKRIPLWFDIGIGHTMGDYCAHYAAIDPRVRYAAAHPETYIHYDHLLIDERGIDRDEFYNWQRETTDDFRYFVGCRLPLDADHTAFASFHWQRKHGHAQAHDIRRFRLLSGHIGRALTLGNRIGTATVLGTALEAALDGLPSAIVLLDRGGRVVTLNRAAEAIVSANDGLSIVDRRLTAAHSDDETAFQQLLAAATARPPGDGGIGIVRRKSRRRGYFIAVSPLPESVIAFTASAPAICVRIGDPEHRQQIPAALLMSLYGLTPSEAAIAARIGGGMTIKQAAADLDIAANTARVHLQRVLAKTSTHRQMELVRLLNATMPLAPRD